jgi:tetratricopeptide (TPR) repeat protein
LPQRSEASILHLAYAHFAAGRHDAAATLCTQLLENEPHHVQAWVLRGIIHLAGSRLATAETSFTQALEADPAGPFAALALHHLGDIRQRCGSDLEAVAFFEHSLAMKPDFAFGWNNLGVSLQRLGRNHDALAAFERALVLDPSYQAALRNCGLVLAIMGQAEKAAAFFARVTTLAPDDSEAWTQLGLVELKRERFPAAEAAFRRALVLDPAMTDLHAHLGEALNGGHRFREADEQFEEWARRSGIVAKPCRIVPAKARVLIVAGAYPCNTPTRFIFGDDRFETLTVYLNRTSAEGALQEQAAALPPIHLVFNAVADADRGAPVLDAVATFCAAIDRPILNPPQRITATRRDRIAGTLADIPGLTVPPLRRMSRAALGVACADKAFFAHPLLVRPAGTHGGRDLCRIGAPDELDAYLAKSPVDAFYLSEFYDYRSADGWYRKYRFIFVDREVYPYHLAVAQDWLVHYFRAAMDRPEFKREEEAFLADYAAALPDAVAETVRAVARRVDLDFAGMDCGIDANGRVVLFEVNASMLVHLDDPREDFPYKHAYVPRIADAIDRLVARRLAREGDHS